MSTHPAPYITEDEYLALERQAEFRNEYFNGRIYAMSGGTYWHAAITGNFYFQLRLALQGRRCSTTSQDLRLRVTPDRYYTYPDIMAVYGDVQFTDNRRDTILNPVLVVEVLSPSTEHLDRTFKFERYRSVPRFKSTSWYLRPRRESKFSAAHRESGLSANSWAETVSALLKVSIAILR